MHQVCGLASVMAFATDVLRVYSLLYSSHCCLVFGPAVDTFMVCWLVHGKGCMRSTSDFGLGFVALCKLGMHIAAKLIYNYGLD